MFKTVVTLYNQMLEKYTRNGCSVYTLFMILQLQWGIKVNNEFIKDTLKVAEQDKVWYESWGAYFSKIYYWFTQAIFKRTGVVVDVISVDIMSNRFEKLLKEGKAFGIGLKNGNSEFFKWSADGELTKYELDKILAMGGGVGHNHTYYNGYIIDSMGTLKDQTIKCDLKTLRYGVSIGLYYNTARTLSLRDKLLEKWLVAFNLKQDIIKTDVKDLDDANFIAMEKASKLRAFKK